MGLLNRINGGTVFIDTAPFVYFVECHSKYVDILYPVFNAIDREEIYAVTTTITCSETLVIPCRQANWRLVEQYETLLAETPALEIVPFDLDLAKRTAEIRAKYGIKTPDAIQWATAVRHGASFFLTNDKGFDRFSDLQILLLDDFLPKPDVIS